MSDTASTKTDTNFTLSLTERAAQRVRDMIAAHGLPETAGLRAGVVEGGCSGLNYDVRIEEAPHSDDTVLLRHGTRVFVNEFSKQYISGMTIDWQSSMVESRFVFENPNATGECGCGVSFTTG